MPPPHLTACRTWHSGPCHHTGHAPCLPPSHCLQDMPLWTLPPHRICPLPPHLTACRTWHSGPCRHTGHAPSSPPHCLQDMPPPHPANCHRTCPPPRSPPCQHRTWHSGPAPSSPRTTSANWCVLVGVWGGGACSCSVRTSVPDGLRCRGLGYRVGAGELP